jgi:hypothetical protein
MNVILLILVNILMDIMQYLLMDSFAAALDSLDNDSTWIAIKLDIKIKSIDDQEIKKINCL